MRVPASPHKIPHSAKQRPPGKAGVLQMLKKLLEPTIGLEPMTCRLRIDCSTN